MKPSFSIQNRTVEMPIGFSNSIKPVKEVWKWGGNNLTPIALASLSRSSTIHRRILKDKADYISGKGIICAPENHNLKNIIELCNGLGESMRSVIHRLVLDKCTFGNAFLEIVTDKNRSFTSIFHQDATRCRLSKDSTHVILHHNWSNFKPQEAITLPIYPHFELQKDDTYRTIIHYKDYEPTFTHYGIPKYIASLNAAKIAYKTDKWNITRLENAFQPSGVMVLDGSVDTAAEAEEIAQIASSKFAGKPGQVMFMVKNGIEGDATKFVPINESTDGDWKELRKESTADIIIAHSWFRALSGIEYSTGFSADRIQYEYQIALNSIISVEQQEILEPLTTLLQNVFNIDCSSLMFVNRPPFNTKPSYMFVWEARAEDGLPYDPEDVNQQKYLANI